MYLNKLTLPSITHTSKIEMKKIVKNSNPFSYVETEHVIDLFTVSAGGIRSKE